MSSSFKIFLSVCGIILLIGGGVFALKKLAIPMQDDDFDSTESEIAEVPQQPSESDESLSRTELLEKQADIQIFQKAIAANDESQCHDIENKNLRSECFDRIRMDTALKNRDLELCKEIANLQIKAFCNDQVLYETAVSQKKPDLCLQITRASLKEKCLQSSGNALVSIADTEQDCQEITSASHQRTCFDTLQLRGLLLADSRDFCSSLKTQGAIETCHDYFWSREATEQKDPTICLNISDRGSQQECEESMKVLIKREEDSVSLLEGESAHCADFLDGELRVQCENEANYYAAKIHRDTAYCTKIQSETFQVRCVNDLTAQNDEYWLSKAQEEQKKEYCDNLSSEAGQEYCKSVS